LPADCLKLLPPDPESNDPWRDWQIEGRKIATNEETTLYIRYTKKVTAPNDMDPLFREVLSCKIAVELCDKLTNSNVKKDQAEGFYDKAITEARKANAFENVSLKPPEDEWITARY
jgi:hypothetical protein